MEKKLKDSLNKLEDDLIHIIRERYSDKLEDRIIHDMLYNIELIRDAHLDVMELRLLCSALKELRHSLKIFKEFYTIPKVAVFGSARTKKSHPDYKIAKAFGKCLAKQKWSAITGGASGIMEAAIVGAGVKNSFGLNIRLPFEQDANFVIKDNKKLMNFKYFFTRKLMFLKESQATVCFPGGYGTFDEGFESLTLVQTGKAKPRPIILIDPPGSKYWKTILTALKKTLEDGAYISKGDLEFMQHFQDPKAAADAIFKFYSNYDSSRFLRSYYLIRTKKKITAANLKVLNKKFKYITTGGEYGFMKNPDADDNKDKSLTRLIFKFDKSNYVGLKKLIDHLNTL